MAKWYTNWVLIIGGLVIIVVVIFEMIPILNDAESLTNTQKLVKAIPVMALSIMAVVFIMIKSLHYRDDKDREKEKAELQDKTNQLQEKHNKLQEENNQLQQDKIDAEKDRAQQEKTHTKEIREFGRLLNENLENDIKTRESIGALTIVIESNELSRNEEIRLMKQDIETLKHDFENHNEDHDVINKTIETIQATLSEHIKSHKQKV